VQHDTLSGEVHRRFLKIENQEVTYVDNVPAQWLHKRRHNCTEHTNGNGAN
jgi:hypothetical protein